MKLRHAARLALAGWLLIETSPSRNPNTPESESPLGRWEIRKRFSTEAECEKWMQARSWLVHDPLFDEYGSAVARKKGEPWDIIRARAFTEAQKCIASDDPRLKEK